MEERIETKISKCYVKSVLTEFDERTGDGMIGRLSREIEELKRERDKLIFEKLKEINDQYFEKIDSINKKIFSKAKLMEK